MFNLYPRLTALVVLAPLALGACEKLKEQIGLTKSSPDEFRVVTHAPLEMPADTSTLPEPQPGAPRPQEGTPEDAAKRTLLGPGALADGAAGQSAGEAALLQVAGATGSDPNIRQVVDQETTAANEAAGNPINFLIFWRDEPPPGVIVDPEKEAQRIKENAALGLPVTNGETPIIVRKEQAIFEGIF